MSDEIRIQITVFDGDLGKVDKTISFPPGSEALEMVSALDGFNPSGDRGMFTIKALSAGLIHMIDRYGHGRSAAIAKTKTQEAKMWGVQSVADRLKLEREPD